MTLKLGKCYELIKADGTIILFKFLGNNPENPQELLVEVNGEKMKESEIFSGGYLSCTEIECN